MHAKQVFWHQRNVFNVFEDQELVGGEKKEIFFPSYKWKIPLSFFLAKRRKGKFK